MSKTARIRLIDIAGTPYSHGDNEDRLPEARALPIRKLDIRFV